MTDPLLELHEAAERLRVSRRHVRDLISKGELAYVRTGKSARSDKVAVSDIEQFIAARRKAPFQSTSAEKRGGSSTAATDALLDGPLRPPARGKRKLSNGSSGSRRTPATVSPISKH